MTRRKPKGPESPCRDICLIHPAEGICVGCYRTAEEISQWSRMPSSERAKILKQLDSRAPALRKRRSRRRRKLRH